MKKFVSGLKVRGDLFSEGRNTNSSQLVERPRALFRGDLQAKKVTVAAEVFLWGCAVQNFRAKLPFNGMRQGFATFRKEIPTALEPIA